MIFGIHWFDFSIVLAYFAVIIYVGVIYGGRKTHTMGDFLVAGGKWGSIISFIFVFASAIAGNEAVVVSGQAYKTGLSGVWYWWNWLFVTPIYLLLATYFRRARVYNLSEFFEMRYDKYTPAAYSVFGTIICILFTGMALLAMAKIISGFTQVNQTQCVWIITIVVGAYVFSGGMTSTLLTDLIQGLMCLTILSFILLPFLWYHAGGWSALQQKSAQHPEMWNFIDPKQMTIWTVLALNISALTGGIACPWLYNWIAISKNERAAVQTAWACYWKRVITLLFALYGILFALYIPGLSDPEQAWGIVIREVLPIGIPGLLIASFLAAVMSSAACFSTTSSALTVDYLYRRMISPGKPLSHYILTARLWAVVTIVLAALSTHYIKGINQYVKFSLEILSFLGIPIYFGIYWKRTNNTGMVLSMVGGILSFILVVVVVMIRKELNFFEAIDPAFIPAVFISTAVSLTGMILGCLFGKGNDPLRLKRFYVIMNTPIGQEQRLVDAGIRLPSLIDAKLVPDGPEEIKPDVVESLYEQDSRDKIFGHNSSIEIRKERGLEWYFPGFLKLLGACFGLILATWLVTKLLFVW